MVAVLLGICDITLCLARRMLYVISHSWTLVRCPILPRIYPFRVLRMLCYAMAMLYARNALVHHKISHHPINEHQRVIILSSEIMRRSCPTCVTGLLVARTGAYI